ncbi:MAG: luciferase [Halobacteriales archaeon SW_9_67_25]|nr:MAG: luciferase [Halobacteriales archaeon SW_9_67_25]
MTALTGATLADVGVDAVALKPTEVDVRRARRLSVETLTIDYEGREHVPEPGTLADLAAGRDVRLTVPVRADGFDPHGEDGLLRSVPDPVGLVAVAGNPAYLDARECRRAIAPRLRAVAGLAEDPWVGTESVERVALAVGGTQYDLLSGTTEAEIDALRSAGFDGDVAVYAPLVLTDDEDAILDALGPYAGRRPDVRQRLPPGTPTDSSTTGSAREALLDGLEQYALAGNVEAISGQVDRLHGAGVDHVVAYPARGLGPFLD